MMNKMIVLSLAVSMIFFAAISASAEQSLLESVVNGCSVELETYCKDVTPGESRVLACLYSRNDKLSGKCEYALYDAAVQLERAVAALSYLVNECADDLEKFCSDIQAGDGRLLNCLGKNAAEVSTRCKDAVAEIAAK